MKNIKLGIIGCGNMGQAILKGILDKKILNKKDILFSDQNKKTVTQITKKYGIKSSKNNIDLVEKTDVIIFAIKPQESDAVFFEVSAYIDHKKFLISIMAGIKMEKMQSFFVKGIAMARVMPNIAAIVGQSISSIAYNPYVNIKHKKIA